MKRFALLALASLLTACSATAPTLLKDGAQAVSAAGQAPVIAASPMPAVAFLDLNDAPHGLAEFKGKTVLLVGFAYWCPHCQEDMPKVQAYVDQHPNLTFVPVESSGGTKAEVQDFKTRYGIKGDVYYDPANKVADMMGLKAYPTAWLLGPDLGVWSNTQGLPPFDTYTQLLK